MHSGDLLAIIGFLAMTIGDIQLIWQWVSEAFKGVVKPPSFYIHAFIGWTALCAIPVVIGAWLMRQKPK
jgi:hypothetical protein